MPLEYEEKIGKPLPRPSTLTILDEEATRSVREAAKVGRAAIREHTPVGETGRLKRAAGYATKRIGRGAVAFMTRKSDGWYGRIVERGREAGFSRGRHYPAAKANPFVDEASEAIAPAVEKLLEAGADRAAARIEAEMTL